MVRNMTRLRQNYSSMDDASLVRHLRQDPGDDEGWAILFKRYHKLIWWHIHRTGENDEELYQDIQYAIWDGLLNRYSGEGKVSSYVGGIIVNQVKRKKRMDIQEPQAELDEIADVVPDPDPTPDQAVIENEAAPQVSDMLKNLKPKEQKMLILQYLGHSHKDIAGILGISSVGASRKFLSKLLGKVSYSCERAEIDSTQFLYGMRVLNRLGELYAMLGF